MTIIHVSNICTKLQITLSNGDINFTKQFCQQQWAGGPTADLYLHIFEPFFEDVYFNRHIKEQFIFIFKYSNRSLEDLLQLEDNTDTVLQCMV